MEVKNMKKLLSLLLLCAMVLTTFAACGSEVVMIDKTSLSSGTAGEENFDIIDIEDEAVALADAPVAAVPSYLVCEAPGTLTKKTQKATIDYSNTKDGYVMVQYTAAATCKLKVQVKGPTTTYTYNIVPQTWASFPFSDGNGDYTIAVF